MYVFMYVLGNGLVSLCAAEFVADAVSVPAKVVFT